MNISYYRKSKFGFDETLDNVLSKIADNGMNVIQKTELEQSMGSLVFVIEKDLTSKILKADHNLIGLVPTSVAVIKKGEAVLVGSVNPELMAGVTPNHDVQHLASDFNKKIRAVINEASGAGEQKVSNVKLYSTHTCPYCKAEKDWLDSNKVKHDAIYLEESQKEAEYVVKSTGQMGVPVTEIIYEDGESEFVIGFDRNKLGEILVK